MPTPIYLVAGQSNASALKDELAFVIESAGAVMVYVGKSGQPLTAPNTGRVAGENTDDWHEPGELQTQAIANISAALLAEPESFFAGVIWIHGEADAWDKTFSYHSTDPDNYANYLAGFLTRIETELAIEFGSRDVGAQGFETTIMQLSTAADGAHIFPNWDVVAQEQADLANADPRIHLVAPEDVAVAAGIPVEEIFADKSHYVDGFQPVLANALAGSLGLPPVDLIVPDGTGTMSGTESADMIIGDATDQDVEGLAGNDLFIAGTGAEQFMFAASHGHDVIQDFDLTTDKIVFTDALDGPTSVDDLTFTDSGKDVLVSYGDNTILLTNMHFRPFTNGARDDIFEFPVTTDPDPDPITPSEFIGTNGDDVFEASPGDQNIFTEGGADVIHVNSNDGDDTVFDFDHLTDKIVFFTGDGGPQSLDDITITDTGRHVEIDYGTGTLTFDRTASFHFNSDAKLANIISFSDDPFDPDDNGTGGGTGDGDGNESGGGPTLPPVTHQGSDTNDRLIGDDTANHMVGDAGSDKLFGRSGDDLMYGGAGSNYIDGGEGDDIIHAEGTHDRVQGDNGNDIIHANAQQTTILFEAIDANSPRTDEIDEIHDFDLGADLIEIDDLDLTDDATARAFLDETAQIVDTDLFLELPDGRAIKILDVVQDDASLDEDEKLDLLVDIF